MREGERGERGGREEERETGGESERERDREEFKRWINIRFMAPHLHNIMIK